MTRRLLELKGHAVSYYAEVWPQPSGGWLVSVKVARSDGFNRYATYIEATLGVKARGSARTRRGAAQLARRLIRSAERAHHLKWGRNSFIVSA